MFRYKLYVRVSKFNETSAFFKKEGNVWYWVCTQRHSYFENTMFSNVMIENVILHYHFDWPRMFISVSLILFSMTSKKKDGITCFHVLLSKRND